MHSISIIIPTLNEELYLPIALQSLMDQTDCEIEAIVVDGKSEDKTVAEAMRVASENKNPRVSIRVLTADRRQVSYQRNLGARVARHDLLLFLDADTTVRAGGSLAKMINLFQRRKLQAATFRLKSLEHRWAADTFYFLFWVFSKAMRHFKPYAAGACLMTTREAFKKAGGFDETIAVNEDGDYCRRVGEFGAFAVLRPAFYTSCRRFEKMGYLKSGVMYLRMGLTRMLSGEIHDPASFKYDFGDFRDRKN